MPRAQRSRIKPHLYQIALGQYIRGGLHNYYLYEETVIQRYTGILNSTDTKVSVRTCMYMLVITWDLFSMTTGMTVCKNLVQTDVKTVDALLHVI